MQPEFPNDWSEERVRQVIEATQIDPLVWARLRHFWIPGVHAAVQERIWNGMLADECERLRRQVSR